MADPVGTATGILALTTFTYKSTVTLFELVKSFKHHNSRVRELSDELISLKNILASLAETIQAIPDVDLSALRIPLQRCAPAVKAFDEALLRWSDPAVKDRRSYRDWARLRYMGEDLDGFRRLLATYKVTINIALTDATL